MRTALIVCFLLLATPMALAQSGDPEQPEQPEQPPQPPQPSRPTFIYTLGQSIQASSVPHLDGGGDAVTTFTRTEFQLVWLASSSTRVILDASNEFASYDFDGAFNLDPAGGDPFGSFNRQNFEVVVSHGITPRWAVQGLVGVGFSRERDADVGDSVVWRAGIGATYSFSEKISLGALLLANSQLESNAEILPLPQIDVTIEFDEQWSFNLATISGATLTYRAFDELAFTLNAGYQEREYRLDDSGFAPEGVFQDKSIDLMLGASWRPINGLEVTAGVGSQLWRRFKIKDEDGNRLSRVETDPTLMFHAGLSYSF